MKESRWRGSFVVATGSGTAIVTAERSRLMTVSLEPSPSSRSSRATLARVEALSSCCEIARSRSSLSNGADCPTRLGDTPDAATATVALARYCFGR